MFDPLTIYVKGFEINRQHKGDTRVTTWDEEEQPFGSLDVRLSLYVPLTTIGSICPFFQCVEDSYVSELIL